MRGTPQPTAVLMVAKRPNKWVAVNESLEEGGRDDEEGVVGGGNVGAKVAEGEVEVRVGVMVVTGRRSNRPMRWLQGEGVRASWARRETKHYPPNAY